MHKYLRYAVITVAVLLAITGCTTNSFVSHCGYKIPATGAGQNLNRAIAVEQTLLNTQKRNDLWQQAGWWNSANILESLIDFNRLTHTDFTQCLQSLYKKNVICFRGHFIMGHAFDDNEWWALAWLKAYDLTGDKKYLAVAQGIFEDCRKRAWDHVCGGGIRWANNIEYKNAITNELFMQLAARLALEPADSAKKDYYLSWAIKDWQWIKNSSMINSDHMINDGLTTDCRNNNGFTWTYNQGVILGALKDLFLLTGDSTYLLQAQTLACASMKKLSNAQGILTEPGDDKPGHDKNQFKGIYIRYLAILNTQLNDTTIKNFILSNAGYVWQHARSADNFIDFNWSGPCKARSGSAQGSAMDMMNAALMQQ